MYFQNCNKHMVQTQAIVYFDKPTNNVGDFWLFLCFLQFLIAFSPADPSSVGVHGDRVRGQATLLWSRLITFLKFKNRWKNKSMAWFQLRTLTSLAGLTTSSPSASTSPTSPILLMETSNSPRFHPVAIIIIIIINIIINIDLKIFLYLLSRTFEP